MGTMYRNGVELPKDKRITAWTAKNKIEKVLGEKLPVLHDPDGVKATPLDVNKDDKITKLYAGKELPENTEPFRPTKEYEKIAKKKVHTGSIKFVGGKEQ
ncbi:MAG: hypothetical protein LBQ05_02300 [Christensenellaceae bacterium]|jgi:hypothetical protein|nr:hypothetical protein [Christensenellaceae bacterium]